jgi:hypothetical protein
MMADMTDTTAKVLPAALRALQAEDARRPLAAPGAVAHHSLILHWHGWDLCVSADSAAMMPVPSEGDLIEVHHTTLRVLDVLTCYGRDEDTGEPYVATHLNVEPGPTED